MGTVKFQPDPEKVLDRLRPRLVAGSDVATSALIYALVHIHQDRQREKYPLLLQVIYHPEWGKYVFRRPRLLCSVLVHYATGNLWNQDAFKVWEKACCLYDKLLLPDLTSSSIQAVLTDYVAALRVRKLPGDKAEERVNRDVARLHEILCSLLSQPTVFPQVQSDEFSDITKRMTNLGPIFEWVVRSSNRLRKDFLPGQGGYDDLSRTYEFSAQNPQHRQLLARIVREKWLGKPL